jgi:hypothetical protein
MGGMQGGGGGAGEGPTLNYDFQGVENLTMNNQYAPFLSWISFYNNRSDLQICDSNIYSVSGDVSLMIQDHRLHDAHVPPAADGGFELSTGWLDLGWLEHELSGPIRNPQHEVRTRSAPYRKF